MRNGIISLLLALGCFGFLYYQAGCTIIDLRPEPDNHDPKAINALRDPLQEELNDRVKVLPIERDVEKYHFTLKPVAHYRISGRVLSRKRYYMEWQRKLSPMDFGIGWGALSTPDFDEYVQFDHGNRFLHYRVRGDSPLDEQYVNQHSSNNHLIPKDLEVEKVLRSVKNNEVIELEGYLVNVVGTVDGGQIFWNTSLVRDDRGGGACEILYVTRVKIKDAVFGTY